MLGVGVKDVGSKFKEAERDIIRKSILGRNGPETDSSWKVIKNYPQLKRTLHKQSTFDL